jgi:mycofactocin system glycosyltransferase
MAERRLARRLVDAGIVRAKWSADWEEEGCFTPRDVSVVVPTSGRLHPLERCLESLAMYSPGVDTLVVDDASQSAEAVFQLARRYGAKWARLSQGRGPAGARNTGLALTSSRFVAFLDDDAVARPGWLERLLTEMQDPALGAVAARILPLSCRSRVAAYESRHSSLDAGPRAGPVGPRHAIRYVPGAALLVRRSAVPSGFDERLTVGEDVDFVWRMAESGWRVRYAPQAEVCHEHRVAAAAFLDRRRAYGRSAGPLSVRHPSAVRAVRVDPYSLAAVVAMACGRLGTGILLTLLQGQRVADAFPAAVTAQPWDVARRTGTSFWKTILCLADAVCRPWAPPALIAALLSRRCRVVVSTAWLLSTVRKCQIDPVEIGLSVADDLWSSIGIWEGCLAARTARPLLPALLGGPSFVRASSLLRRVKSLG